ncbi:hypothetical protein MLD38_030433 [Melastoma candidum]|uniref:Uncharacterized protein n=1 Tax=Melastoma candidum TaxID=119954 RepID=A0ACB9MLQ2_9MYRT|nr:hypothetical protein MLD38_030433 [Melastoma candidum]
MSARSGSDQVQKKDLEGGIKENQQDDALRYTYEEKGQESWKTIRWLLLLLLNLVAASSDPFFFYIPTINAEGKCLRPDRNLSIAAITLRFFVDVLQLMLWLLCNEEQLLAKVCCSMARPCQQDPSREISDSTAGADNTAEPASSSESSSDTTYQRHKKVGRVIQFASILPLPQVATIIIIAMEGSTKSPHAVTLLKFCVLSQFVIRAIRVFPSYKDATRKSPMLLRGRFWVGAAFNLLLFVIVGHVLGAFWYLLSVGRNMDCWKRACENHHGCDVATLYCLRSSGDKTYLNESCPIETSDNPPFDFGIYLPALQSHVVSSSDFSLKLAYCFWWGLRNLSSLAQNLTTSAYQWEICFAISISIFGLILFALLIGNMQTYLQCLTNKDIKEMKDRRDKIKEIRNILVKWMPFLKLPEELRAQMIWCEDPKWLENKDVDLKGVLTTISPDLSLQIKEKLCLPILLKVSLFSKLNTLPLKALCSCAKPQIFPKNGYILRADSPIKQVILIVCGKACSYKKEDGESGVSPETLPVEYFGDEILNLDFYSKTLTKFPLAPRHIKAVTKVEAFVIGVKDLRQVWSDYKGRLHEDEMRNWARMILRKGVRQRSLTKRTKMSSQDALDAWANSPRMHQA